MVPSPLQANFRSADNNDNDLSRQNYHF